MNLDYSKVKSKLKEVKDKVDDLLDYMDANQSATNRKMIDLEVYLRLADISTHVLQSDCQQPIRQRELLDNENK